MEVQPNNAAGSEQVVETKPATVSDNVFATNTQIVKAEEKPLQAAEKPVEVKKEEGEGTPTPKPEEKKETGAEGVASSETPKETKPFEDFKFDNQRELGKDLTYQSLGADLGFEVKENTLEAFREAQQQKLQEAEAKAREGSLMTFLEKESPKDQLAFMLSKEGMSLSDIERPAQQIDAYLKLNSFDLVKQDLLAATDQNGRHIFNEETANTELEKLVEEGRLELNAHKVREALNVAKNEHFEYVDKLRNDLTAKQQLAEQNYQKQQAESVEKALMSRKEYAGMELPESVKQNFVSELKAGRFNDIINSPDAKVDAILNKFLLDRVIKHVERSTEQKYIEKELKERHNVPAKNGGAGATNLGDPTNVFAR